jgi:hypothetical protein
MDTFLLSGNQRIKIKVIREFREIVKKLVANSGVDFEFPEETEPSIGLKIMVWLLRILAFFLGLYAFWVWLVFIVSGASIIGVTLTLLVAWAIVFLMYGLVIIIPTVIMYRDEQKQLRLELRTLIDIAEAAISVLKNQRCKSMKNEINHAEKLIEEYRKNKLSSNDGV